MTETIKVKESVVLNSKAAFEALMDVRLPIQAAHMVGLFITELDEHLQQFEKSRMRLVKQLGVEDKEKGLHVPEDKLPEFSAEMQKLLDLEIELKSKPLDVSTFGDARIEPKFMLLLSPFLK